MVKLNLWLMAFGMSGLALAQSEFNMREVSEDPRPMIQKLSASTAAMVPMENLLPDSKNVKENTGAFKRMSSMYRMTDKKTRARILEAFEIEEKQSQSYTPIYRSLVDRGYCEDFSMAKQKSFSNCSGTLISDRHILTAGHCADEKNMCHDYRWVFGYQKNSDGKLPENYSNDNVYHCKDIVASINVRMNIGIITRLYQTFLRTDFAIIELDRPVKDREAVKLSNEPKIEPGEKVFSISYPLGMPAKVNFGGEVQSALDTAAYFWTSLVVFGGSSGGPIFNEETGELVGVISKGISTTMKDSDRACIYEKHPDMIEGVNDEGQRNSNAQMKKILETLKKKKIPVSIQ